MFGLFKHSVVSIVWFGLTLIAPVAQAQPVVESESGAYADALRLLEGRRFVQAADAFEAFRNRFPTSALQPDAAFYEGSALLAAGRDTEAIDVLSRFESVYPEHALAYEARVALGRYYFESGQSELAIETLQAVLRGNPPPETAARALYWMGDASLELDRPDDALRYYGQASDDYRGTNTAPRAQYARAFTNVRIGRYEEGARAFEVLAARFPDSPFARNVGLALAEVYYELGDWSRTVSEITSRMPSLDSAGAERAEFLLAECYNQLRDNEQAIIHYRRFTENSPGSPYYRRAVYGLAWNYFREGANQWASEQFALVQDGDDQIAREALYYEAVNLKLAARTMDAMERFERYARQYEGEELADQALFELGIMQYENRMWQQANTTFGQLIVDYPQSPLMGQAHTHRGNTYIALGNFDAALASFERAIVLESADPTLRDAIIFQKAWLLYRRADYPAAGRAFEELYAVNPTGAEAGEALFWSAESRFQRDQFEEAGKRFRQYLRDFPAGKHVEAAHYALGWVYFRQSRYDAAIPEFQQFLANYQDTSEIVPYKADAQLRLADSFFALKRYVEAVRVYGRLAADGDDYALYQIGQAYSNAGDPIEAIATFRRLLEEYPVSEWREEARYSLGYLFFLNQEYDTAITEYGALIRSHPQSALAAKAQYGIGDALFNAGRLNAAVSAYMRVLDRYPNSLFAADAASGIQFALVAAGESSRSAALIDSFATANPTSPLVDELRFRQAEVRFQSGDTEGARNELLAFVRSAQDTRLLSEAYYYLGTAYADAGETREAENYLRQILQTYPQSPRRAAAAARLGHLYNEQNRSESALSAFISMEEAAAGDARLLAEARYGRSIALSALGRRTEAEALLREAIDAAPDDPNNMAAYVGLGRVEEERGLTGSARERYRKAASLGRDEVGAEALVRLGSMLRRIGDPRGALNELGRMPTLFAGYPVWMARGYLEQARSLADLGQRGDAASTYDLIIERYIDTPESKAAQSEKEALLGQ